MNTLNFERLVKNHSDGHTFDMDLMKQYDGSR